MATVFPNAYSIITNVIVSSSVASIADGVFSGCGALTSIAVPQCVCSSGMGAVFPDAYQSIKHVVIQDTVSGIANSAFEGCTALETISIPESVTSIGDYAFRGCIALADVTFAGDAPSVGAQPFLRVASGAVAHVGSDASGFPAEGETWNRLKVKYNTPTPASYDIVWRDEDGTVLATDSVAFGTVPSYGGATPTKEQDAQYVYTFAGWNAPVVAVSGPATYTATYSAALRAYVVTWYDFDSSLIDSDAFYYGDKPEYHGEALVRDGYEFTGWFTSTTGGEPLDESFAISGKTSFFARWKQIRFLEGDVACIDGSVTLTSAQIAWLNGLGDYETIKASVAAMDSKAFEDAYLLNLDVTDAGRGYSFDVTGCDATGENVVVSVRLVRTGTVRKSGVDAPINGVLMLCGATAPAKDGFAPLSEIVIDNAKFSNGDEATLIFSKDATTRFFKPVVAMP